MAYRDASPRSDTSDTWISAREPSPLDDDSFLFCDTRASSSRLQDAYPNNWIEAIILARRSTESKLRELHQKLADRLDTGPNGPRGAEYITCETCAETTAILVPLSVMDAFRQMTSGMWMPTKDGHRSVTCVCVKCIEAERPGTAIEKFMKSIKTKKQSRNAKKKLKPKPAVHVPPNKVSKPRKIKKAGKAGKYKQSEPTHHVHGLDGGLTVGELQKIYQRCNKKYRNSGKAQRNAMKELAVEAAIAAKRDKRPDFEAEVAAGQSKTSFQSEPLLDYLETIVQELPMREPLGTTGSLKARPRTPDLQTEEGCGYQYDCLLVPRPLGA
ncbi:hypothetical protein Slin15195_G053640 [Septoria linicola]|uniref:Uncharacterized protein n=1 Tax=Septoria linicola TaxID=215465 RepID=A0A9Q9AT32_9PEZI|nr:hypothetical protein Slin14017_G124440 [Septoria linicola]USW52045.1 hypothetical protein Slin15195_G053640 [Septoria linicola]